MQIEITPETYRKLVADGVIVETWRDIKSMGNGGKVENIRVLDTLSVAGSVSEDFTIWGSQYVLQGYVDSCGNDILDDLCELVEWTVEDLSAHERMRLADAIARKEKEGA